MGELGLRRNGVDAVDCVDEVDGGAAEDGIVWRIRVDWGECAGFWEFSGW